MQLRVPNQYKPSFFQNLLSGIIPVPTRRILSDKKLQKQKKINLSLAQDKKAKSSRKITLSNSFQQKQTPSTKYRNQHINNTQTATYRSNNHLNNRGLNFRPYKINFHNQNTIKPKIKTQLILYPSTNSYKKQGQNFLSNSYKKCQHKNNQLSNPRLRDKRIPAFFDNHHKHISQNCNMDMNKSINQNPQFNNKSFQQIYTQIVHRFLQENSSEKTQQTSQNTNGNINIHERISIQEILPKQSFQQIQITNKQVNKRSNQSNQNITKQNVAKQKQQQNINSTILPNNRQSQFYIDEGQQENISKEQINKTPSNPRNSLKLKTQQKQAKQLIIQTFINNLYQKQTIESKYDQSYRKTQSDCYSNVIYRLNGNQLNNEVKNSPRDWDQMRRKSLNTNLLHKFQQNQQNQQSIYCTQHPRMNFRKKHFQVQSRQQYPLKMTENYDSLKYIEDMFITNPNQFNKISYSYVTDTNHDQLQVIKKKKTFYDEFNKINYIGVGRFASVYLCISSSANFIFAIKQILKFTVMYNSLEQQLKKQIDIQYQCNHPHLIALYHAWYDSKKYYLALQYGQQTLLNRLQKQNNLAELDCLRYIKQIAKGLQYLHQKGIVHRDLKPQNIVLVNGISKIADFGWATKIQSGILNQACGTPCYISPQIEKSKGYTCKTDCWSLGVLAYQLINGKMDEQFFSRSGLDRDFLYYKRPVSVGYKKLVYSLLSEDEKDRPSANQILNLQIIKNI